MTGPASSILRCDDGTELPFEWVYPDAEQSEWIRDRSHWPQPLTPMEVWLRQAGWPGADRAWAEVEMEPPAIFYRFQLAGPFLYARTSPYTLDRLAVMAKRYRAVARRYGNAQGFWQQYAQPRIEAACAQLANTDGDASLQSAAELWAYGFHQTFTSSALLMEASLRLNGLLTESAGTDAALIALEVTQGGDNASQAIDGEIGELARLARETPAVARLLASGATGEALESLRHEPTAATFVAAFDALVEKHGSRSQGWELVLPTWRERPTMPFSLICAHLESESVSPEELTARSAAIRRAATERALGLLPEDKHADFARIVAELDGYVGVREGRAYWQMVISGEVRGLLLRKGAGLVQDGRIDRAEDILFLVPDDFEGDAVADLRRVVAERGAEWERWRQLVPPDIIGTPATAPVAAAGAPDELRGAPASRGQVTGPARILHGPEEGVRLKSGDILVCVMTTPAWTPLFSMASGIVTETGGPLSHPAITAREYGIPAVVAVKDATARIRDGQMITVDGGAGTVSLSG